MKIRLTSAIARVGKTTLRSGRAFDVLDGSLGPPIGDKSGFCSIEVDGAPFTVFSVEFEKARWFSAWILTVLILLTALMQVL